MSRDVFAAEQVIEAAIDNDPTLLAKIEAAQHGSKTSATGGSRSHLELKAAEIIAVLEQFLLHYLILPGQAVLPLACWIAATYLYKSFDSFPYLAVVSPTKQCGKTRLAEVLSCLALNPRMTTGISEAALFRLVDQGECTLLLDEAESLKDTRNERSQAIVSILNAGYRQGNPVVRCANAKHELQEFSTYCPKALMAIGTLPPTVFDRSIVIQMRRKKADENTGRFISRHARAQSEPLRNTLAELSLTHPEAITGAYENLPEFPELSDRDQEIWQPLLAICTVLCSERIAELKRAALALSRGKAESDVDDSLPLRLLSDLAPLLEDFGENVPSVELVSKLKQLTESPWNEPGNELTQNRLARMLRPFEVRPRTIRMGHGQTPKGYVKTDILEAVSVYVSCPTATTATNQ